MFKLKELSLLPVLLAGLVSLACEGTQEPGMALVADQAPGISWEELRRSAVLAPNGSLVVEDDMAFEDEEHLRRFWMEDRAPRSGAALTVNQTTVNGIAVDDLWSFPQSLNLTYCVGSGFTEEQLAQLTPALDAAGAAWANLVNVRFVRVTPPGTCNATNSAVVFDVQHVAGSAFTATSFFPSMPRSSRTLFVYDKAFTNTAYGATLAGILTHELGHSLGFRHEHIWIGCTSEGTSSARAVTPYDVSSIMHYPQCRTPAGGGYVMSALDYAGSITLYGMAAALVGSSSLGSLL